MPKLIRSSISATVTSATVRKRLSRTLASTLALLSLAVSQAPVWGQETGNRGNERCFTVADNNPAGNGDGGIGFTDTLASIDFDTNQIQNLGPIQGPNGPITNIEAMTSRPNFDELIAANGNEIGRLNPFNGRYTPIGTLGPYADFDAIDIDPNSPNQTRLLGVSKDPNDALNNVLVEAIIETDNQGRAIGVSAPQALAQIPQADFPPNSDSIDGIAISSDGTLYGVANRGPDTPRSQSLQYLVIIDQATGALQVIQTFEADGTSINDVEDISFDLFGNLFISSGSNFSRFADTGFIIDLGTTGRPGRALTTLDLSSAGRDFEASACLPFFEEGNLLVVKRITAVVSNGVETQFEEFVDQDGDTSDNRLSEATDGTFPQGLVQTPTALLPGDEVEYTVYLYNPSGFIFDRAVLCDAIEPPSILQSGSVEFSEPGDDLTLNFSDRTAFARAPLAPADAACEAVLDGASQFLSGPPGPTGGLDVGAGGGIVTDEFDIGRNQIAALRFRITVGQGNFE